MNPYKILNITPSATKQDIVKAVARAMRERVYAGGEISLAQKILMNPASKAVEDFICFPDTKPFAEAHKSAVRKDVSETALSPDDLKYIPFSKEDS